MLPIYKRFVPFKTIYTYIYSEKWSLSTSLPMWPLSVLLTAMAGASTEPRLIFEIQWAAMRKRHGQRCRSCDGVGIQPCNVHTWLMGNGFQSQLHYVDVCIGQSCHLSLMFPKLYWWTTCRFAIGWWFLIYQSLDPSNKVSIVFHCFHGFHPWPWAPHFANMGWRNTNKQASPTLLEGFSWKPEVFQENPRFSSSKWENPRF